MLASLLSLLDLYHRGGHGRHQTLPRARRRPHDLRRPQWKMVQVSLKVDLECLLRLWANAKSPLRPHLQLAARFLADPLHHRLVQLAQQPRPSFPPKFPLLAHHLACLPHHQLELRFLRLRPLRLVLYHSLLPLLLLLHLHLLQEGLLLLRQLQRYHQGLLHHPQAALDPLFRHHLPL
jgi:hypothetical protein